MTTIQLILSEIRFRWLNFVLSLIAVVTAATLFVAGPTFLAGYAEDTNRQLAEMDKKTIRIMRDLGVNLRIVHKDTNMGGLYTDFVAVDFPESYVQDLAKAPSIHTIVHLVATLQQKMKWQDRTILLVGMLPVVTDSQLNEKKQHMVQAIEPGTVVVGHELAGGKSAGDSIEINGHAFTIAKIRPESGTQEDIQLVLDLHDAQRVTGLEGRIHQIMALNCKCKGDRISVIRKELEGVLPDTRVTEHASLATAREKQRDLVANNRGRQQKAMAGVLGVMTPLVVVVSALFVALLTWLNVRERRPEIGLLRAIGKGTFSIVLLFMGRAAALGLAGGMIGCCLGYVLAPLIGSRVLEIGGEMFTTDPKFVVATLFGAPIVAAMASYLPTLVAVTQDPAVVLADN